MEQRLKHYFATYKTSNECFVTSDALIFHKRHDATAHASTLADKNVKGYTRAEVEAVKEDKNPKANNPKAGKLKVVKPEEEEEEEEEEGEDETGAPVTGAEETGTPEAGGEKKAGKKKPAEKK